MFLGATDLHTCCPPHPVSAHLSLGLWWEGPARFLSAAQGLPATVFWSVSLIPSFRFAPGEEDGQCSQCSG